MNFACRKIAAAPVFVTMAAILTACASSDDRPPLPPQPVYQQPVPQTPVVPSFSGPVLQQDGTCSAQVPSTATAIDVGIGECDLVRLKGRPPTDVLIGESGRGGRETQVLYAEPTGRELYFFINNRLDRIVK